MAGPLAQLVAGMTGVNASPILLALAAQVDANSAAITDMVDRLSWIEGCVAMGDGLVGGQLDELRNLAVELRELASEARRPPP